MKNLIIPILVAAFAFTSSTLTYNSKYKSRDHVYNIVGLTLLNGEPAFEIGTNDIVCPGGLFPCQIVVLGPDDLSSPVLLSIITDPSRIIITSYQWL